MDQMRKSPSDLAAHFNLSDLGPSIGPLSSEFQSDPVGAVSNLALSEADLAQAVKAQKAFVHGDFDGAVDLLKSLFESRPDDIRIKHNFCLANCLMLSKSHGDKTNKSTTEELVKLAQELSDILNQQKSSSTDFDEFENAVLIYNLALTQFFLGKFKSSYSLLEKLINVIGSGNVNVCDEISQSIHSLSVSLCLLLNLPKKALKYLDTLEKSGYSQEKVTFLRAFALVKDKQFKTFKRDLKIGNNLSTKLEVVYDFLRAHLEFLRGNYKKALKYLSGMSLDGSTAEGTDFTIFQNNNLGCIYTMMNKPDLALHHVKLAYTAQLGLKPKRIGNEWTDNVMKLRKLERMVYNFGVIQLYRGNFEGAMQAFQICSETSASNYHVYLRMAEAAIGYCTEKELGFTELLKPETTDQKLNLQYRSVGDGKLQKIFLGDAPTSRRSDVRYQEGDFSLKFAQECLSNALYLIRKRETSATNDGICSEEPFSSKFNSVKAAILLKHSFVNLCLFNPTPALISAKEILALANPVPQGYRVLARIYAAEALLILDRISEAIGILDPKGITDVSFLESKEDESSVKRPTEQMVSALQASKAIFTFNLAVAFLTRGEIEKAEKMLDVLWANRKLHRLANAVFQTKIYVLLKKGASPSVIHELIKTHCSIKPMV